MFLRKKNLNTTTLSIWFEFSPSKPSFFVNKEEIQRLTDGHVLTEKVMPIENFIQVG